MVATLPFPGSNRTFHTTKKLAGFSNLSVQQCSRSDSVCLSGRLASQQVWGGESDESGNEEDDVEKSSKSGNEDEVRRSGKLLVLQQILPLWEAQVGICSADMCVVEHEYTPLPCAMKLRQS